MSGQGRKNDAGKLRYDLIPAKAWQEVVKAITYGASEYGDDNWKRVPNGRQRFYAADMRHTEKWRIGEEIYDPESKAHHLACSITNLLFILEKELQGWEDVPEQEDISQEELKSYIDSVVESEKEKLWYPPVEDGGNPWVEWFPTPLDILPKGVSESTVVDVLMDYEREEKEFETSPQKARDCYWGDSKIVAYRVV